MYWYLIVVVLLGGLMLVSIRNRRRQVAADVERSARIAIGTEVMTTSGLYGTVVAKHDDETVLLAIAPGVEVKWASAALRDADSLSDTYRRAIDANTSGNETGDEPEGSMHLRKHGDGSADTGRI